MTPKTRLSFIEMDLDCDTDDMPLPNGKLNLIPRQSSNHGLRKRIVMNPPASYLEYAATFQPPAPAIPAGPLVVAQDGQVVMLAPSSGDTQPQAHDQAQAQAQNSNDDASAGGAKTGPEIGQGEVQLSGSSLILMPTFSPTTALLALSTDTPTPTRTSGDTTITPDSAVTSTAVSIESTPTSTQAMTTTTDSTSTSSTMTSSFTSSQSSSASASNAISSSFSSSSSAASASATSSAKANPNSAHKPPSAGIIFLIVLLCLIVFIALGSLFRYLLSNRFKLPSCSCFGGRRRNDDDDDDMKFDGLGGIRGIGGLGGMGVYDPYSDGTEYDHGHGHSDIYGSGADGGHTGEREKRDRGDGDEGLSRRASLFAHAHSQGDTSPFLHSGTASLPSPPMAFPSRSQSQTQPFLTATVSSYLDPLPLSLPFPPATYQGGMKGNSLYAKEQSIAPHPSHLYGETGPLEVRNALPGEVDDLDMDMDNNGPGGRVSDKGFGDHTFQGERRMAGGVDGLVGLGLGGGSPRFLGVDGNGLSVPWSVSLPHRPSSIDSFDASHPNPFGSSSTLTAAGANTGNDNAALTAPPMFHSPAPSHDDLSLPQRSATWASNLRNTLYNAISSARVPTLAAGALGGADTGMPEEDRFTRSVGAGVVDRAASRRRGIPSFEPTYGHGHDVEKGLRVVEEKDDPFLIPPVMPVPPTLMTTSVPEDVVAKATILSRLESTSSSDTSTSIPRRLGAGTLGAGERYKRYYARPKSGESLSVPMSEGVTAATKDDDSRSASEAVRPPTVLAGGGRAKGARTGSFVIV